MLQANWATKCAKSAKSQKVSNKNVPGVVGTMPQKLQEKSKNICFGKNDGGKKTNTGDKKHEIVNTYP